MENNHQHIELKEQSTAFAALTAFTSSGNYGQPEKQKTLSLMNNLNTAELKVLASRGVVKVIIDCRNLSSEIKHAQRIVRRQNAIDRLIAVGSPYEMMRIFGISQREFRFKRKAANVSNINNSRPQLPTDEEIKRIGAMKNLFFDNSILEDSFLKIIDGTGIAAITVWQVIREYPEIKKKLES